MVTEAAGALRWEDVPDVGPVARVPGGGQAIVSHDGTGWRYVVTGPRQRADGRAASEAEAKRASAAARRDISGLATETGAERRADVIRDELTTARRDAERLEGELAGALTAMNGEAAG